MTTTPQFRTLRSTGAGRVLRTAAIASMVGTTIEWYDFLIYGTVAGIVFNRYFFPTGDELTGTLLAYTAFAVGFVVRPLGGLLFGHFGDRIGRKPLLILTLTIMGLGTFLMGLLPTYKQIGIAAPLILLVLRITQGIALGGEWGGSVLMAYEHAPEEKRGYYASIPQVGLAVGLCCGTGVLTLLSFLLSNDAFVTWGWRVAFMASIVLLAVGLFIRLRVEETPEFAATKAKHEVATMPIVEVLRRYPRSVLLGCGARMIDGVIFTVFVIFIYTLLVTVGGMSRTAVLAAVTGAAFILIFTIPIASRLADRFGRKRLYVIFSIVLGLIGFPSLALMQYSGSIAVAAACIIVVLGVLYAPIYGLEASIFSALFDTRVRYTGNSLVYQIGAIPSISVTPLIATALLAAGGNQPWLIAAYIAVAGFISAICVALMKRVG